MSIGDMGRPTAKFRLWLGQPVNAPFVTPPFWLRALLLLCILGAFTTILYGLAIQLRIGDPIHFSTVQLIGIAVLYVVVPICASITISNNRKLSRPLILLYVGSIAHLAYSQIQSMMFTTTQKSIGIGVIFVVALCVIWWLFLSKKMRVYYALISGRELPSKLRHKAVEIMLPGVVEQRFSRLAKVLAPFTEYLLLLIAIFVAIAGLWII